MKADNLIKLMEIIQGGTIEKPVEIRTDLQIKANLELMGLLSNLVTLELMKATINAFVFGGIRNKWWAWKVLRNYAVLYQKQTTDEIEK